MLDRDRLLTQLKEAMHVDPAYKSPVVGRHLAVVKALGIIARTFAGVSDAHEKELATLTSRLDKAEQQVSSLSKQVAERKNTV